jgi:hypothetical protein
MVTKLFSLPLILIIWSPKEFLIISFPQLLGCFHLVAHHFSIQPIMPFASHSSPTARSLYKGFLNHPKDFQPEGSNCSVCQNGKPSAWFLPKSQSYTLTFKWQLFNLAVGAAVWSFFSGHLNLSADFSKILMFWEGKELKLWQKQHFNLKVWTIVISAFHRLIFFNGKYALLLENLNFLKFVLKFGHKFSPPEGKSIFLLLLQVWLRVIVQKTVFIYTQTHLTLLALDTNFTLHSACQAHTAV